VIRKVKAVWRGAGPGGSGELSTVPGVLAKTFHSYRACFQNEKGTNPDELIAAAHVGCFTMTLAFVPQGRNRTPNRSTSAREGSHLAIDGPIGRRWKVNLTSVGEPTLDAKTLSALRTTWSRSKHWSPWEVEEVGIRKGPRR
jgi:organic hydroperoxide reductase OsmC/OhrA